MLEAVLWDVDGVIVDSEEIYFQAIKETFSPHVNITEEEYIDRYMINLTNTPGMVKDYKLEERFGLTLEDIKKRKEKIVFNLIDKKMEMMPHAMELLNYFNEKRYPMGVVSSAGEKEISKKLGKFSLTDMFKAIVTANSTTKRKPDPEPYLKGIYLLNQEIKKEIPPKNFLVIEDNPSGVKSAKKAGCRVIAYPNGFTERFRGYMKQAGADEVVSILNEINDDMIYRIFHPYKSFFSFRTK